MISFLKGTVIGKDETSVTVMTSGGVGYDVELTPEHAARVSVGSGIELPVYLKVGEAALDLYGFQHADEKEFFMQLLSVSGVGPKTAMHILSLGGLPNIQDAIARADAAYLTTVQGIGRKTAERIIVELKSKVTRHETHTMGQADGAVLSEVIDGLVALGYSKEEARDAVQDLATEGKNTETILREALRKVK